MSTPDSTAPAQPAPDAGQGGGSGLYAEALASVPEQYRQYVEPHYKKWDQQVGPKLQEAAEYRKKWEPFEQLGVHELEPGVLQELLQFHEVASDQDQFLKWYQEIGEQLREQGLLDAQEEQEIEDDGVDPEIRKSLTGIEQQFQEFQQWRQQQEQERAVHEANTFLSSEMETIKQANPNMKFSEEIENAIYTFARNHADSDRANCVKKGFADYQALVGAAEKGLFQQKSQAPATPETGGRPNTQAQPITSFEDARQAALGRMREQSF